MNIIQMNAQGSQAESLDSLWLEAERLGEVKVDRAWIANEYQVTISFKRPSGTRVYAAGADKVIQFAVANAINEAREMGA